MLDDSEVHRVLVVTAHPDDVDFAVAGTVALWRRSGIEVTYCVITDGDAGGFDPAVPRTEIPGIRRAEQVAAASVVGVSDVRFLGYSDGELVVSHDLRRDISRVIRQARPDRVVIQSPERNWERVYGSHPDHLAAGEAAMQAIYPDARNPFAHPALAAEGLEAWTVPEVWVMGGPQPNHWVDTTAVFGLKIAALRAHESQTGHREDLEDFIRGWNQRTAALGGLADDHVAEMFMVVSTA